MRRQARKNSAVRRPGGVPDNSGKRGTAFSKHGILKKPLIFAALLWAMTSAANAPVTLRAEMPGDYVYSNPGGGSSGSGSGSGSSNSGNTSSGSGGSGSSSSNSGSSSSSSTSNSSSEYDSASSNSGPFRPSTPSSSGGNEQTASPPSSGDNSGGGNNEGGNTGNSGSSNGGQSTAPAGPTPEELEAAARAAAESNARVQESKAAELEEAVSGLVEETTAGIAAGESASKEAAGDKENSVTNAAKPGDPVLATTGSFLLETEDYEVPGSSFSIRRKYISEEATIGSVGAGWFASADSRIMRGVTEVSDSVLNEMSAKIAAILKCYAAINKQYGTTAAIAARIYQNMYLPNLAALNELLAVKARGQELAALNGYSKFPGTPPYYEGAGNENLVVIDEEGTPRVYEPEGDGAWVPVNYPERLWERLESLDKKGAESRAGFILSEKGGRKRHYNGDGLLVMVTELNGNRTELRRDSEGRLTLIKGPHGNEWGIRYSGNFIGLITGPEGTEFRYGYDGDHLAWVKDRDNDTVTYRYEGKLKEIVKPDNSAIKLDYGYTGAGGSLLVTTTTHEEGSDEKFEYNPAQGVTTYTNHSGVITRFWYDEAHRTTREDHGDGTIKTFLYNQVGLLEKETVNGFEIRYRYDKRGNVTEKAYGDGTREKWEWNGNDQITGHTGRDGVITEWKYDSLWNPVEVRRGGEPLFTGTYDQRNRLVMSREGDRPEIRYEYDSRDYVKTATLTINGGIREQWEHDAFGRTLKFVDGLGREWEYTYHPKETTEKTPLGLERRYVYNNRKDLARIIEKDTNTGEERELTLRYDRRHLPLEITDGTGNATRYEYRADGELIRKEQGPWYWEYTYDPGGRISGVTRGKKESPRTYAETYGYARQGWNEELTITRAITGTTAYGINPFGHITAVTNAQGERTIRTVNGAGNALREQGFAGGFYEYRYDTQGRPIEAGREGEPGIQARYNRDGSVAEKTDRLGNVTRYVYDGKGLLTREITALGEERYYYDEANRLIRRETVSRNSNAYYTQWQYNDASRTVTVTAGGTYTETLHLNAWGEVIKRVDGEGNEKQYEYDKAGKLIKIIDGYGRETRYEWNELEKLKKILYIDNTAEEYHYDPIGNLEEIRDALGVAWSGVYDEAGRLVKETGRPGIDREYGYDSLGRIVEVKNGGEIVERYQYTGRGREAVFTDGYGKEFTWRKNPYGEFTGDTNRAGDNQQYRFDTEGRLTASRAYSGKEIKTEYRDAEGLTITSYADGSQRVIERDLSGNVLRVSGETGTIRYKYNAGGKLTEQNDEGAGEITGYTYDKAGQRIRMLSGNRDIRYWYGKNGELLRVRDNSQRLEASYEYDSRGRETLRIYGNGIRQETIYDRIGRVILIRESDSQNRLFRAEGYIYDDQGRRSLTVDEEGQVTKYEYDNQSRLITVLYPWTKEKAEADRKEAEEAGLHFTPEKGNGERYNFTGTEIAALRNILNRALPFRGNAVSGSHLMWRETYTYDRNGNRASKATPWGVIKYQYDAENRLVRKGDILYTNDEDGNILSEKGPGYEAFYRYNSQNRIVYSEITNPAEKTREASSYVYDALGRRTLTRSVTGQISRTLYDGKGFEVIREGETFSDGSLTTRYAPGDPFSNTQSNQATGERYRWVSDGSVGRATTESYTVTESRYGGRGVTLYGKGEALAVSYNSAQENLSSYLGKDIQGSVRTATSIAGNLEARYEYDAFGRPFRGDLAGGMNLGYTGKPYDPATGLYNYGYRDFHPETARFTTPDPIRDGANWFAYANNDPINWVDLWGLLPITMKDMISHLEGPDGRIVIVTQSKSDSNSRVIDEKTKVDQFTSNVRDLVGTPYEYGGKTTAGIDCSGVITYSLNQMGYDVPATSAREMASGDVDWLTVTQGETMLQDRSGVLNFYDWNSRVVRHVNVGVGQKEGEIKGQIVDATEGNWMTGRNANPGQAIPAGSGQVNQTYAPYSANSKPVSQGLINFSVLEEKYKSSPSESRINNKKTN